MRLRYSPLSPYVRKVMVVALETGLAERIERVPTTVAPTTPNEDMARENPLVKVPSLTTDDGLVLYDSPVICEYLDTLHSGPKLFPPSGKARWIALRQQALGDGILDAAILGRYESVRPAQFLWQDWIDAQLRKVRGAVDALEIEVEGGGLGAANAQPTIGPITIGCALGYLDFRYQREDWRARARRLAAWYAGFAERRSMELTAPRLTQRPGGRLRHRQRDDVAGIDDPRAVEVGLQELLRLVPGDLVQDVVGVEPLVRVDIAEAAP
jgi:glutathione S-transferase